jgi:hypothetical protein
LIAVVLISGFFKTSTIQEALLADTLGKRGDIDGRMGLRKGIENTVYLVRKTYFKL